MRRLFVALVLTPSFAHAQTATTYNYNTVAANNNVNTSTSTNTNVNQNVNSGTVTNNNNNVSTSTNVNTDTSTSTVNQTVNTTATNRNINTDTSSSTVNQTVSATNSNVNVNDSTSTSYSETVNRQVIDQNIKSPPPSAIAPSMMSYSQDLCTAGVSGAVQTQILGFSAGRTVRDQNCERLKLSKTLFDMGMRVAAVSVLCQDLRVFDAMLQAGTPCPYEGQIGDKAKMEWIANPDKKPKK